MLYILSWLIIIFCPIITFLAVCTFFLAKYPNTKFSKWVKNNIIDKDPTENYFDEQSFFQKNKVIVNKDKFLIIYNSQLPLRKLSLYMKIILEGKWNRTQKFYFRINKTTSSHQKELNLCANHNSFFKPNIDYI